jgi:DNA-binding response OmpR family regulator
VASGELALERLLASRRGFGLLVSDVMLSRMTGFDLARQVGEYDPELPILLLSGQGESVLEGRKEMPFLSKPFTVDELYEHVNRLVRRGVAVAPVAPRPSGEGEVEEGASLPQGSGAH